MAETLAAPRTPEFLSTMRGAWYRLFVRQTGALTLFVTQQGNHSRWRLAVEMSNSQAYVLGSFATRREAVQAAQRLFEAEVPWSSLAIAYLSTRPGSLKVWMGEIEPRLGSIMRGETKTWEVI